MSLAHSGAPNSGSQESVGANALKLTSAASSDPLCFGLPEPAIPPSLEIARYPKPNTWGFLVCDLEFLKLCKLPSSWNPSLGVTTALALRDVTPSDIKQLNDRLEGRIPGGEVRNEALGSATNPLLFLSFRVF